MSWVQKNLFFIGLKDSQLYRLYAGHPGATPPDYDISRFIRADNWRQLDSQIIKAGPIRPNPDFSLKPTDEQKTKNEKIILMVVVIFLVAIIGSFIFQLIKKTSV